MATIRRAILEQLVTRLSAIAGWNVQLRLAENAGRHAVEAIVFLLGEDKVHANDQLYACTMTVGVEISARVADAHPTTDDGNPYHYLDRLVAEVEKQIHTPDDWPIDGFTDVHIDGHDVADPPAENEFMTVEALVRLTFTYRHSIHSPEDA
jgi:hypothetical protein